MTGGCQLPCWVKYDSLSACPSGLLRARSAWWVCGYQRLFCGILRKVRVADPWVLIQGLVVSAARFRSSDHWALGFLVTEVSVTLVRGSVPPRTYRYAIVLCNCGLNAESKECSNMSEYKFCRRCGTQLGPDDNFCTACGAPTGEDFLVAGDGLPVMPVGQVAPEAPLPEAAAPVPGALDVAAASGETVSSDNPTAAWGGVDTAAIPEPMAPSVSPAMGWDPSPEQSGVAPDAGTVDTPSGPIPASDALGPSDVSGGAEAFNTDGIANASAQPFAFVPPYGGGVTGASDAVGQAPVTTTSPSAADISSVSADTDDRWFAKVLDVDDAPAAFASASGGDPPRPPHP